MKETNAMSMTLQELPEVLTNVRTRTLFWLRETVPPLYVVGATPDAFRRIGVVITGSFEGERLSGTVVSGNDWQNVRRDNCTKLDVMTYQCLRAGTSSVMELLDRGHAVDPASYYFRFAAFFETGDPRYDWINRIVAVGVGSRLADGPLYNVFEVL
jgi:hypothetical protein